MTASEKPDRNALPPDVAAKVRDAIARCLEEELDVEVGLVRSGVLYDRLMTIMGTAIYDQAIADAQVWLQVRIIDMAGDLDVGA